MTNLQKLKHCEVDIIDTNKASHKSLRSGPGARRGKVQNGPLDIKACPNQHHLLPYLSQARRERQPIYQGCALPSQTNIFGCLQKLLRRIGRSLDVCTAWPSWPESCKETTQPGWIYCTARPLLIRKTLFCGDRTCSVTITLFDGHKTLPSVE